MNSRTNIIAAACIGGLLGQGMGVSSTLASSHREAPAITATPKLDGTDFYMFRSYEEGREDFVTIVACYQPLQDPYGGPNYYPLATDGLYEIHVDNDGDAVEDITFQFRPSIEYKKISLTIGPEGDQRDVAIPLIVAGQVTREDQSLLNVIERYTLDVVTGDRRDGEVASVTHSDGETAFIKPVDYIGQKALPDYESYVDQYIYEVSIPGSAVPGRAFVGQRKDPFVVNLGETFDLVNITNPLGPVAGERDDLSDKNVTAFVLEVPISFLVGSGDGVIGAWTTASMLDAEGNATQVSRLGQPLVNEVVIGLKDTAVAGILDKDAFNLVEPTVPGDAVLIDYVTHPVLPAVLELLFGAAGVQAPTAIPRNDLVTVFLTGIPGLNQTATAAEYLRLNTGVAPVSAIEQNNLGVIAGDNAGFPNGRRLGDDVVDIALRVVMGKLLSEEDAPSGQLPFTDGALVDASMFDESFPYVTTPLPGSPGDFSVNVTLTASESADGPFAAVQSVYDAKDQKLVTPKSNPDRQFYRLDADGPVVLDGQRVDTVPNVQLGIARSE